MATYKVSRSDNPKNCPVGTNGLLYYGSNLSVANRAFDIADVGIDAWGQKNPNYGVVLSEYNLEARDFVVKRTKFSGVKQ